MTRAIVAMSFIAALGRIGGDCQARMPFALRALRHFVNAQLEPHWNCMEANDENVREITPHQITPSKGLRAALGWLAEPADNPSGKETKNAY
jgi:hypothetical protein